MKKLLTLLITVALVLPVWADPRDTMPGSPDAIYQNDLDLRNMINNRVGVDGDNICLDNPTLCVDVNTNTVKVTGDLNVTGDIDSNASITVASGTVTGNMQVVGILLVADGAVGAPGIAFISDKSNGIYRIGSNNFGFATNGIKRMDLSTTLNMNTNILLNAFDIIGVNIIYVNDGDAGTPTYTFTDDVDTGIYRTNATINFAAGGSRAGSFSDPVGVDTRETSLWVYDKDNNAVQRVTVGVADSGGSGYKLLRLPN